jgi:hypothetical protein
MPAYVTAPNGVRQGLQMGIPAYSAGSFASSIANTRMFVTSSAVTTNVVTLGVVLQEGNIPAVGATAYITGTSNGSATLNKPAGVVLTGVTLDGTGTGTITYALTTSNLAQTPDGGLVIVPQVEVGDSLTSTTKYLQFAVPSPIGGGGTGVETLTWSTVVSGAPSGVTVNLQASIVDIDAQYATLDSSTNTTGETRYIAATDFNFFRITTGTITGGTSPTLVAKLLV